MPVIAIISLVWKLIIEAVLILILAMIRKNWGYFWLIISLAFICTATLSPFNFDFVILDGLNWQTISDRFEFGSNLKDYWQNILLFIPFGFSLSAIINRLQKQSVTVVISLIIGFILSTSIELSQLLLPSRVSNLSDIVCNSIGGLVGSILFYLKNNIIYFLVAIFTGNIQKLTYRSILKAIIIYCSIVVLAIFTLLNNVNLNNWDSNYYLAIGNEVTGVRPWSGKIQSLQISDRCSNNSDISRLLTRQNSFPNSKYEPIIAFDFEGNNSKKAIELIWQKGDDNKPNSNVSNTYVLDISSKNKYISVNSQHWLKTKFPATHLNNKLKNNDEFTISMRVATNDIKQNDPARIVTLAAGIYTHNLLVAQKKKDLHFRLRTPITGKNAASPELIIPDVFNDTLFHNIVITFARRTLSFYIDRPNRKYSFTFNPYNSYRALIPWNHPPSWSINLQDISDSKHEIIFYVATVIPVLFLIAIFSWKLAIAK